MSLDAWKRWLFGRTEPDPPTATGPRLQAEGRPTVQLTADPESEIRRAENVTKDPSARAAYAGHVNAVWELIVRGDTTSENLSRLTAGLDCSHKLLRDEIGEQLMRLSHHFEAVGEEFLRVMREAPSGRRLELVKAVWRITPPRPVTLRLLTLGLEDQEERVRYFAVDRVRTGEVLELLPNLKALRQRECDLKLQRFIDYNLGLLEAGFYVEQKPDTGDRLVTINLGKGGVASQSIPAAEYSPEGVRSVLAGLRAKWRQMHPPSGR